MVCLECIAPSLYNLIVFTIVVMVVLTVCGIVYGLIKVIDYERRRRLRLRADSEEGQPLHAVTV